MMHQLRFIILCGLCISGSLASDAVKPSAVAAKKSTQTTSTETSVKVSSSDVNSAEFPFETSHKHPLQPKEDFHTSHRISDEALRHREDLHQSMRSKEKPELNEQLGELIGADIRNNIEAKRLSEYERYVVEPLTTTERPVLTTPTVAQSINEGLIDDFSVLEEAGTENKQASRIQIKKGPNGQDYEYEYVYYYYDDDEAKNPEDDDVIIGSRKGTQPTTTTQAPSGKSRYANIERGAASTAAPERNEIQSRGKARSQSLPAPVSEEIVEERLPLVTRFPQRAKSANPETVPVESNKKHQVKRPSLELVDSHSFVTDEKDKNSKGPRIIETELSKSELIETVSRSSVVYASSTVEPSDDDVEDTTPLMEKLAIDLYAILANENAKEDEKKRFDGDETTVAGDDELTTISDIDTERPSSTTTTPAPTTTRTTTTTTTEAPTTTSEAAKGRGSLTAGRNRFNFKSKGASSTEAPSESLAEALKPKNRFNRPSPSFSRSTGARSGKTTNAPEEVKETAEKSEAPASSQSKLPSKGRNRFSPRSQSAQSTTEKSSDSESTTASRLVKPRPQFSVRNRSRSGVTTSAPSETNETVDESTGEEKPVEKASSAAPRPTSRSNLNRPTVSSRLLPGQKPRSSPLSSRRTNDENNEGNKSANENESDLETTTQNNLNKLKSRPRIQINTDAKAKKTASPAVVNRKVNPLISKRKFGVTSTTEASADGESVDESSVKEEAGESEVEAKEDETTQASDATSETPKGLGILNRRKLANSRRPGQLN